MAVLVHLVTISQNEVTEFRIAGVDMSNNFDFTLHREINLQCKLA